jgi:hypothetical protein
MCCADHEPCQRVIRGRLEDLSRLLQGEIGPSIEQMEGVAERLVQRPYRL